MVDKALVSLNSISFGITILAFLFTPTLEPAGLFVLAFVAVIAAASKFLITIRGRHLFNPAALGVFVVGLMGLGYASWWVATPVLLPFVVLVGLAIFYKTRRLAVAGIFLAIAIPMLLVTLMSGGLTLVESIPLLASWPLFFFAGVMLSEPLTLPPKKWQQYIEAAVVALLFALPIEIGDFNTTPALALLVGNLLAFAFARRTSIILEFKKRRTLTPTADEFVFRPLMPVNYQAGQYMELTVAHPRKDLRGIRRSFSVTSSPSSDDVTFGVKFYEPSSTFKKALKQIKPGTKISATMVAGEFVLPKDTAQPLLYVAGGIGITPFISQLQYLIAQRQTRDIVLIYAVASIEELAYADVLMKAGIKVIVVTKEKSVLPKGWHLVQAPYLSKEIIEKAVPDSARRQVYISGPPGLVDGAKRILRSLGARRIKTDYFVGY